MIRSQLRWLLRRNLIAGCSAFAIAAPSLADSPASVPPAGEAGAHAAFQSFASTWMEKVHGLEEQERRNPTVRPGADRPIVTYRGYDDDFTIELRPTGHPSAPYVGILRYREHLYSCASVNAISCTVASTVPVTEIFRFENGRWVY